jgi:hypothetical protein
LNKLYAMTAVMDPAMPPTCCPNINRCSLIFVYGLGFWRKDVWVDEQYLLLRRFHSIYTKSKAQANTS